MFQQWAHILALTHTRALIIGKNVLLASINTVYIMLSRLSDFV